MTGQTRVIKKYEPFVLGYCNCGCKKEINLRTSKGSLKLFENRHNLKILKGEKHSQWKGGIRPTKKGYERIYAPNHPFKDNNNTVFRHRLVYEQHYNCILLPWVDIHHRNKNIKDNNIKNLQPIIRKNHTILHNKSRRYKIIDKSDRFCIHCKVNESKEKSGENHWYGNEKDGWVCKKCHDKLRIKRKSKRILYLRGLYLN